MSSVVKRWPEAITDTVLVADIGAVADADAEAEAQHASLPPATTVRTRPRHLAGASFWAMVFMTVVASGALAVLGGAPRPAPSQAAPAASAPPPPVVLAPPAPAPPPTPSITIALDELDAVPDDPAPPPRTKAKPKPKKPAPKCHAGLTAKGTRIQRACVPAAPRPGERTSHR